MLFMVIERFAGNDMGPVYRRLAERGRMLPDGVRYVTSWVAADFSTCWQVMECADRAQLDAWMAEWAGTGVTFEAVVPVLTSDEARAAWAGQADHSALAPESLPDGGPSASPGTGAAAK